MGILGHSEGAAVAFMLGADNNPGLFSNPNFIIAIGAQAVRGDSVLIDQSATMLGQGNMPANIVSDYVEALHKMYELKITRVIVWLLAILRLYVQIGRIHQFTSSLKSNLTKIASDTNRWLNYYISFSPTESIADTDCPIFVLYGEKDIQVRPELNMPQMQRLAPKATVKLYPELNHLFQYAQTGTVQEYGKSRKQSP